MKEPYKNKQSNLKDVFFEGTISQKKFPKITKKQSKQKVNGNAENCVGYTF